MLDEMDLLTQADGDTLAIYCQSLARLAECERMIEEEGATYKTYTSTGELSQIKTHPAARMAKELYTTVCRLGKEFGLSPSARAHLNVQDSKPPTLTEKQKLFDVG
jgi:P27 family predicted phage terminase small subunit